MMENQCSHTYDNGDNAIVFEKRFYGKLTTYKKGICMICGDNFIVKVGDNDEDRKWSDI